MYLPKTTRTAVSSATIGADLISMERGGSTYIYMYDGHGSVRGLIDAEGKLTDTYNYDAFGVMLERTGETENSYLYCGEQQDDTTGLYYLRARYMNPATGTFTSMDTYGGSVFDPTSLHKYLYANANPVSYTDPSGYVSLGEVVVTSTIIGALTGAAFGAGISILRQLILKPKGKIDWKEVGKAALIGFGLGAAFGCLAGFAKFFVVAAAISVALQVVFLGISIGVTIYDWVKYNHNKKLLLLDLFLVGLSIFGLTKGVKNLKTVAENAKQTAEAAETVKSATDTSPENNNTSSGSQSGNKGGRLGNAKTRALNKNIADKLQKNKFDITGGGGQTKEEYLPPQNGGRKGGNYVDITAEKDGVTYRINTVDTYADGTPTAREANAANSINAKTPGDPEIILIPKDATEAEIISILQENGLIP